MVWHLIPFYAIRAAVLFLLYILGLLWSLLASLVEVLAFVFHPVIGIANLVLNAANSVLGLLKTFKVWQSTRPL